jgi:hypothetical protein
MPVIIHNHPGATVERQGNFTYGKQGKLYYLEIWKLNGCAHPI